MNILNKLKSLSVSYPVHLQWFNINIKVTKLQMHLLKPVLMSTSVPSASLTHLLGAVFTELKAEIKQTISASASLVSGSTRPGGCL
ncbi:hypothetical protein AVEN_201045-1 [Araneus ventricosus]|uniref:Uncharacterized protein n=1 Tax=Araneus ventricosus TaxID=182803 RepID=A0A4Y2V2Q9_ARAVE|nr:hypothetical protein AVEN_201045-1 [Araneus ventricosus]